MAEVTVDTNNLKRKIAKFQAELAVDSKDILGQASIKGAESAAKFCPPKKDGSWNKSIKATDYKRPIYNILYLLKNSKFKKFSTELRQKFNQGFRYFIYKDVRKRQKRWYTKTYRQGKSKYGRIKYRGFMKIMYGLQLLNHGYKSNLFSNLLKKSPSLNNLSTYNTLQYKADKNHYQYINTNKSYDSPSLASMALNKSVPTIKRVLNKKLKEWQKKNYGDGKL